jgi:uncharacterized protein
MAKTRSALQSLECSTAILDGHSTGPSFPMIPYADATLRIARFRLDSRYDAVAVAQQRAMNLALGRILDPVAGGFHRYAVDATWTGPQFYTKRVKYTSELLVPNLWLGTRENITFALLDFLSHENP